MSNINETAVIQGGEYKVKNVTKKKSKLLSDLLRDRYLYLFPLPVIAYYLIFKYLPMYGVIISFKNYTFSKGIMGSPWVGLKHFIRLFSSPDFFLILKNTLLLNVYGLAFGFPVPIFLAILLNEVGNKTYKKLVQSFLYIPHFISWIVLGGIVISVLSPGTGVINGILKNVFQMEPIYFMVDSAWWPVVYVLSGIWQSAGWGTIIYLAAITGIDAELYEAATIDGANKFQQIWTITLPCIKSTIAILLVLRMGHMLDVGFEHIYVLQNAAVRSVSDVISTYVYRIGIQGTQYSYTAALGLFQSVIGLILVVSTNRIVKKMGEGGLW